MFSLVRYLIVKTKRLFSYVLKSGTFLKRNEAHYMLPQPTGTYGTRMFLEENLMFLIENKVSNIPNQMGI